MQILLFASLLLLQINFGLVLEMSSGETCFVLTLKVSAGGCKSIFQNLEEKLTLFLTSGPVCSYDFS